MSKKGGMRRAARVDKNQAEIVQALRQAGASVQPLHMVGDGCPDLLVGFRGHCFVVEIKSQKGKLTDAQVEWSARWSGQYAVAFTVEQALAAIGAARVTE